MSSLLWYLLRRVGSQLAVLTSPLATVLLAVELLGLELWLPWEFEFEFRLLLLLTLISWATAVKASMASLSCRLSVPWLA